ncbi:hypothetical protein KAU33_02365 [Candidatus Dependentiae bacterium]|nr:hypothetical protein [Candidatus Dependentiae bacterium]
MSLDKVPKRLKWLPIIMIVWCLVLSGLEIALASDINDEYINEKISIANDNDWGEYSEINSTFFLILDGEPYTIYIENNEASFEYGVPEIYDFKVITTKSNADKWWKIAGYYFENGEFTMRQKYLDIPWLYFNTPIQAFGTTGNIAYAVQIVQKTAINII